MTAKQTMKAMVLNQLGDADVFQQEEYPVPALKPDHMLIQVAATSVNPLDTMLRSVETPWSENLPKILHGDVAGTVLAIGADVEGFNLGDKVYGCAGGIAGTDGALAEQMLVDADLMAHKPETLSMEEAAALPLVSITAWEVLVDKMKVSAGDNVLVHGATGGVGHVAVQLAKALGAHVTTTALEKSLAQAEHVGADHVVNADKETVAEYVEKYTQGKGFDAVFDPIAGAHIQESFEAVRFNGQVATTLPIENPLQIALKGLSFHSVLQPIRLIHGIDRKHHGDILSNVAKLVDEGKIKPLIDQSRFSIWEVSEAHKRLQSGQAVGKIVLTA